MLQGEELPSVCQQPMPGWQQGLTQGQDDAMIDLPGVPERERPSHHFQPSQQPSQAGGRASPRGRVSPRSTCQVCQVFPYVSTSLLISAASAALGTPGAYSIPDITCAASPLHHSHVKISTSLAISAVWGTSNAWSIPDIACTASSLHHS